MKRLYRNQGSVTLTGADQELVGANDKRKAIFISAPVANRTTISFGANAVLDVGLNMYAAGPVLKLDEDSIGQAIREDIRCISSAAGGVQGFVEILEG